MPSSILTDAQNGSVGLHYFGTPMACDYKLQLGELILSSDIKTVSVYAKCPVFMELKTELDGKEINQGKSLGS